MGLGRNAIQPSTPIMAAKVYFPLFVLALIFNSSALAQTADLRVQANASNNPFETIEDSDSVQGELSTPLRTRDVSAGVGGSISSAGASVRPGLTITGFAEAAAAGYGEWAGSNASVSIHGKLADFVIAGDNGSKNILLPPVDMATGGGGNRSAAYSFEFFETSSHRMIAQGSAEDRSEGFGVTGDFVKEDFTIGPHEHLLLSNRTMPIDVSQITSGADLTLTHRWSAYGDTFMEGAGVGSVTIVPEPSAWILFSIGLLAVLSRFRPKLQHNCKNNRNPTLPVPA